MSAEHTNPKLNNSNGGDTPVDASVPPQEELERQEHEALVSRLFDRLAQLGVARVCVRYHGSEDDGYIDEIDLSMEPGCSVPSLSETEFDRGPLEDAIQQVVFREATESHGSWETDLGSDGTCEFNVAFREVVNQNDERQEGDEGNW